MSYHFAPGAAYGPLRFGMTGDEVEALLGKPLSFRWPFDGIPIDVETKRMTKDTRIMDFLETQTSNDFPQVTFDNGRVVAFSLFDTKDPVHLGDIDLFDKDRNGVLRQLARLEDTYYENGEEFFFPKCGVCLPSKKYSRTLPYIILIDPRYQLSRLEFSLYDPTVRLS